MSSAIPYTVRVINAHKDTKKVYLFDKEFKDKYVIIESPIENITYDDLLYQVKVNPLTVGLIYITWRSLGVYNADAGYGIYDIFDKKIYVHLVDGNGTNVIIPFDIKIDPHQNQKNVTILNAEFLIDERARIFFNMPGETSFEFNFYMKERDSDENL